MSDTSANYKAAESMWNFLMGANIMSALYEKKIIKSATITPSFSRAELERKVCYILKSLISKIIKGADLESQISSIKINRGNVSVNFNYVNLDSSAATRTFQIIDTISRGFSNSQVEKRETINKNFLEFYSNIHSYSIDIKSNFCEYAIPEERTRNQRQAVAPLSGGERVQAIVNSIDAIIQIIQEYIVFRNYCYESMINRETGTFRDGFAFNMMDIFYLCKACTSDTIFNQTILQEMEEINRRLNTCDISNFANIRYDNNEIGKTIVFSTFRNECPEDIIAQITSLRAYILQTFPEIKTTETNITGN